MRSTLRRRLVWSCLYLARLPSLSPPVVTPEAEARFALVADELLAGGTVTVPEPRLDFLRWLAEHRPVVFHGSPRDDLRELSTERRSSDTTAWGNQEAVYASTDPVWAIYFACLRRDRGWTGTRNGSMGLAGGPLYPRRYCFLHNRGSASPDRFGPGSLYLLSPRLSSRTSRSQGRSTPRTSSPTNRSGRSLGSTSRRTTSPSATASATTATANRAGSPCFARRERAGGGSRTRVTTRRSLSAACRTSAAYFSSQASDFVTDSLAPSGPGSEEECSGTGSIRPTGTISVRRPMR